jgi:hypothetical protein
VLDTLESFDGMERLFVMAVGLDSVRTTVGCCGIYRAITRAHMFVCVVQEHLEGGWLEFTANVKLNKGDFDATTEKARVVRTNLSRMKFGNLIDSAEQHQNVGGGVDWYDNFGKEKCVHSDGAGNVASVAEGGAQLVTTVMSLRPGATKNKEIVQTVWADNRGNFTTAVNPEFDPFGPVPFMRIAGIDNYHLGKVSNMSLNKKVSFGCLPNVFDE